MKRDWRILRVRQWESTRFWVESQTRKTIKHLVDAEDCTCSCEWTDFHKEGEQIAWCAHIRRVRIWLRENPIRPKNGKEALSNLKIGRAVEIPALKLKAFRVLLARKAPEIQVEEQSRGMWAIVAPLPACPSSAPPLSI